MLNSERRQQSRGLFGGARNSGWVPGEGLESQEASLGRDLGQALWHGRRGSTAAAARAGPCLARPAGGAAVGAGRRLLAPGLEESSGLGFFHPRAAVFFTGTGSPGTLETLGNLLYWGVLLGLGCWKQRGAGAGFRTPRPKSWVAAAGQEGREGRRTLSAACN